MKHTYAFALALILLQTANSSSLTAEYKMIRSTANNIHNYWDLIAYDKNQIFNFNVNVGFFPTTYHDSNITHQRITLHSPGLYLVNPNLDKSPSMSEVFEIERVKFNLSETMIYDTNAVKNNKKGYQWRPGDFFVITNPNDNRNHIEFEKNCYFGQTKDAFTFIYALNKLHSRPNTLDPENPFIHLKDIALDAQCYGTLRLINSLYYLSKNEQTREIENFFLKAGIDRIQKEKLLNMITTICIQTPLKNVSDGPIAMTTKLFKQYNISSIVTRLIPSIGINRTKVIIDFTTESMIRNAIIPKINTYNPSELTELEKLQVCDYFRTDHPNMSLFMTTAKEDRTVGDWDVDTFFKNFPVNADRKYLIPSPKFGHCKVDYRQILAKNAFLRKYESSYYKFTDEQFTQGEKHLEFAQKGQDENINEYIEYMENIENYPYGDE